MILIISFFLDTAVQVEGLEIGSVAQLHKLKAAFAKPWNSETVRMSNIFATGIRIISEVHELFSFSTFLWDINRSYSQPIVHSMSRVE